MIMVLWREIGGEYSPSRIYDMHKQFLPRSLFGSDQFEDVVQMGDSHKEYV
jgi:hypothetical protein